VQILKNNKFFEALQDYEKIFNGEYSEKAGTSHIEFLAIFVAGGFSEIKVEGENERKNKVPALSITRFHIIMDYTEAQGYTVKVECDSVDPTISNSPKRRWLYYPENYNFEIQPNRRCRLGLENIGATCYMNATLQCLCNIPQLQNYFLYNNEISKKPNSKLSRSFRDLMRNLYTKEDKKSYAPKEFKELIGNMNSLFRGINANDSKDLILFLYEKIHEELNILNNYNNTEQNIPNDLLQFRQNDYSLNSSIIEKTFYSEQITIYQCDNCKNETTNYGIQNIIIFPLEKIRINLERKITNG
jgi:ubiquitin C-terminal hydrolase